MEIPYMLQQMAYAGQRRASVNPLLRAFYDHLLNVGKALEMIEGDGDPLPLEEQTAILRAALPVGAELAAAVAIAEDAQKGLADALAVARAALPADAPAAPSDGEAPRLRNFWVRWVSPGAPIVTLTSPWWHDGVETTETSLGLRQGTAPVFVAAVRAVDKAHAERVIFRGVTGADVVVEFVKEMPSDWSPFCERFPRADWMDWPEIPRPQVGDTVQVAEPPGHVLTAASAVADPPAPSASEAPRIRNFWVQWTCPGTSAVVLNAPWWQYQLRGHSTPTFHAAIRATDEAGAERAIRNAVQGDGVSIELVQEKPWDWSPFCERFPRADWMDWPEIPRPQVGDTVQVAGLPGHALTVDTQREEASTPDGLQGLVAALTIFAKYNPKARTHCEDQVLWIMGVTLQEIAPEDRRALYELSFSWDALEECWCSSWFGAS